MFPERTTYGRNWVLPEIHYRREDIQIISDEDVDNRDVPRLQFPIEGKVFKNVIVDLRNDISKEDDRPLITFDSLKVRGSGKLNLLTAVLLTMNTDEYRKKYIQYASKLFISLIIKKFALDPYSADILMVGYMSMLVNIYYPDMGKDDKISLVEIAYGSKSADVAKLYIEATDLKSFLEDVRENENLEERGKITVDTFFTIVGTLTFSDKITLLCSIESIEAFMSYCYVYNSVMYKRLPIYQFLHKEKPFFDECDGIVKEYRRSIIAV